MREIITSICFVFVVKALVLFLTTRQADDYVMIILEREVKRT